MTNQVLISFCSFLMGLLFLPMEGAASNQTIEKTIFDVLSYQEVLEVDLAFDTEEVLENRFNKASHPAILSFVDEGGAQQQWQVKLSLRGKFRRARCTEMLPLRVDFSKKDLKAAGLAPFDDFKLVSYCMGDDKQAREALLKEYLVYKLYNQITEASFRVQLLRINYKDILTGESRTQYGFLIEDTAQLRDRVEAEKVDSTIVFSKEIFHPFYWKSTALFQYMIGNGDWGLTLSKNVKYLSKDDQLIPVPYDFDFAAVVDASYSVPKKDANLASGRGRFFKGFQEEPDAMQPVIDVFVDKRAVLFATVQNFKLLKASSRKKMIDYLSFFYENIGKIEFEND